MDRMRFLLRRCTAAESRRAMLLSGMGEVARAMALVACVAVGATVVRNVTDTLQHVAGTAPGEMVTGHVRGGVFAGL